MLALFLRRGSTANDGITALTLAAAATAMITVSAVDLFYHISRDIGLHHTARAPPPAHLPPRATQNCLPLPPRDASRRTERRATPVHLVRGRDETCPDSTEGGTRRVQLVREGGGGGRPNGRPRGPPSAGAAPLAPRGGCPPPPFSLRAPLP
jgi:hypothetical protein